ncbi:MAG: LysE family translocator [Flavobacteriaceae bacterium]
MVEDIQAAAPLGFFLAFMLGPAFFVLIETSIEKGFRAATFFDLGVIFSDIIFILIAYFSSYQLLENINNQPGLYVFGGTLLSLYGASNFIKKTTAQTTTIKEKNQANYTGLFVKGFLLNIINIGVLVFWLGLVIVVTPNLGGNYKRIIVFFSTLIVSYFLTDLIKILLAKRMKAYLKKDNIIKAKKALGILIFVFGLFLIIKGFLPNKTLTSQNLIDGIGM